VILQFTFAETLSLECGFPYGFYSIFYIFIRDEISRICNGIEGRWVGQLIPLLAYVGVSVIFRTDRLKRELQMVQLSAPRCSFVAILWVSIMSFAAITLCVASQPVFIAVVYFVIDSVRKRLDTRVQRIFGLVQTWRSHGNKIHIMVFCVTILCSDVVGY
jgi:hypothetical protein